MAHEHLRFSCSSCVAYNHIRKTRLDRTTLTISATVFMMVGQPISLMYF